MPISGKLKTIAGLGCPPLTGYRLNTADCASFYHTGLVGFKDGGNLPGNAGVPTGQMPQWAMPATVAINGIRKTVPAATRGRRLIPERDSHGYTVNHCPQPHGVVARVCGSGAMGVDVTSCHLRSLSRAPQDQILPSLGSSPSGRFAPMHAIRGMLQGCLSKPKQRLWNGHSGLSAIRLSTPSVTTDLYKPIVTHSTGIPGTWRAVT